MANILVPRRIPLPILPSRRVRNGLLPSHLTPHWVARSCNFVTAHCRKAVFQKQLALASVAGVGNFTRQWRWLCRTGEASTGPGALKLVVVATGFPLSKWYMEVDDGATQTQSDTVLYTPGAIDTLDDLGTMIAEVNVDPDTEYECFIRTEAQSRPLWSAAVFEVHAGAVDTADAIAVDQRKFFNKAPIYDADMQDLVQAPHDLWKHNRSQLLSLARDHGHVGGGAWTRTANSYVNMLDDGSTTVDASSFGFNLPMEFANPYHTTDVTAVFGVFATNANSAGGDVRLEDASGTLGTLSSFSTAGEWKTTTVTLTGGSDQKVDIQFRGDGTNELSVEAVSLYLYET